MREPLERAGAESSKKLLLYVQRFMAVFSGFGSKSLPI